MQLTEWLLAKLKALFGGRIYEGHDASQAQEVLIAWRECVQDLGKKEVMTTMNHLRQHGKKNNEFAPSVIEFRQLAAELRTLASREIFPPRRLNAASEYNREFAREQIKKIKALLEKK